MPPTSCKALLKDYCSNCTIGGVHFIADDTKHWSERWLWVFLVALSWGCSVLLIINSFEAFLYNPISFGLETTYTDWDTKMPSVAVCELSNDDMVYNVSDTIWPPDHLLDLEDALKEIAYFRGMCYTIIDVCFTPESPDKNCLTSDFRKYAKMVRSPCKKLLRNCTYNNKLFDCCEYFQDIDTDMGNCFIINSIQTENPKPYKMVSNLKQKQGVLSFEVLSKSMMYTLGEDEVPSITTLQSSTMAIQFGYKYKRQVTVKNIENDPLVVHTETEQRACRFYSENEDGLYPHYSYSACTVLCRKRAQVDICQCNDHFMLGTTEAERCNISGLACLHNNANILTTVKPHWATRPGLVCECLPSCDETEVTIIKDVITSSRKKNKYHADVEVVLAYLPTERFKRSVVRSRLDLVVSIGGTAGLFLGASLLSFMELIFYFTVRFISNLCMEKQRRQTRRLSVIREESLEYYEDDHNMMIRYDDRRDMMKGPYENSGVRSLQLPYYTYHHY